VLKIENKINTAYFLLPVWVFRTYFPGSAKKKKNIKRVLKKKRYV